MAKYVKGSGFWLEARPAHKDKGGFKTTEAFSKNASAPWMVVTSGPPGFEIALKQSLVSRSIRMYFTNVQENIAVTGVPHVEGFTTTRSTPSKDVGILDEIDLELSIPEGGSITATNGKGWNVTSTESGVIKVPVGTQTIQFTGKGAPGVAYQDPGQPYIAPSGPIYSTRQVWVPGTAAVNGRRWAIESSWTAWNITGSVGETSEEAQAGLARVKQGTDSSGYKWNGRPGEETTQSVGYRSANYRNYHVRQSGDKWFVWCERQGVVVESYVKTPATSGYYKDERYISGYTNPGQPYIAPSTKYHTGASTVIRVAGLERNFIGSSSASAASNTSHTVNVVEYNIGYIDIVIPEGVDRIRFSNLSMLNTSPEIRFADNDEITRITSLKGYGLNSFPRVQSSSLMSVPAELPAVITNLSNAFKGTGSFNQNLTLWDVSNVTKWDNVKGPNQSVTMLPEKLR